MGTTFGSRYLDRQHVHRSIESNSIWGWGELNVCQHMLLMERRPPVIARPHAALNRINATADLHESFMWVKRIHTHTHLTYQLSYLALPHILQRRDDYRWKSKAPYSQLKFKSEYVLIWVLKVKWFDWSVCCITKFVRC